MRLKAVNGGRAFRFAAAIYWWQRSPSDCPDEGWVELERDGWNHFPVSAYLGAGPFDFRVTAIDGQALLEEGIAYVPGGVVTGQGQFE
jgi:hypothetical protein